MIKEGKRFVAYSSALDLSTSATTFELAKKRFDDAARLFFKEIIKMGTLEGVLLQLGWYRAGTRWLPPQCGPTLHCRFL